MGEAFLSWIRRNQYAAVFYVTLISFFGFCIWRLYGFSIFPDEFGYWAYAARAAGYDWSEVVSLCSFYSCGYSLFLFPIFRFCEDAVTAYRIAVALNFVLIGVAYRILCRVWMRIMPDRREVCQVCSAVAMFYPAVLFYAQTTMAETLLMAGYLCVLLLFERYLRKQGYLCIILIFAVNFYMYFVHMRTIGIFAVCVGLMLLAEIRKGRDCRKIILIIIMTLVSLFAAVILKKYTSAYLYQNVNLELYEINTYSGQLEKIRYIFSRDGIVAFMAGLCGKVLYMGIATCGTAYWGICFLMKRCLCGKCHRKGSDGLMEAFVLLTVLSQIVISTIYNVIPDSYDSVTFGRYHDFVMPVLIMAGIVAGIKEITCRAGRSVRCLAVTGALYLVFTAIVLHYVTGLELAEMKGYFMTGMCLYEPGESGVAGFYVASCLIGILCMCLWGFILFLHKKSGSRQILYVLAALQLLAALRLGDQYIYPFNRLAREDIKVAREIKREVSIIYVDYNDISAIGLMQFVLRDRPIRVISEEQCIAGEAIDGESIILLGAGDPAWEELQKKYGNEIIGGHFVLLYNEEAWK